MRGFTDEGTKELMENYDLDEDEAEHMKEIMEEHGLSEEESSEIKDDL